MNTQLSSISLDLVDVSSKIKMDFEIHGRTFYTIEVNEMYESINTLGEMEYIWKRGTRKVATKETVTDNTTAALLHDYVNVIETKEVKRSKSVTLWDRFISKYYG